MAGLLSNVEPINGCFLLPIMYDDGDLVDLLLMLRLRHSPTKIGVAVIKGSLWAFIPKHSATAEAPKVGLQKS